MIYDFITLYFRKAISKKRVFKTYFCSLISFKKYENFLYKSFKNANNNSSFY